MNAYAAILCQGDNIEGQTACGQVELTLEEYMHQLNKPDSGWFCPHCGSTADFDDNYFEDLHYKETQST